MVAPDPDSLPFPPLSRLPGPGGELVYRRLGAGPDLVMLHGLLGSTGRWQGMAPRLARHFTCWMLELPGISASLDTAADYSLPGLARWLERALHALGLTEIALLASSWGGGISLQFGSHLPPTVRLRSLVLSAPIHPGWHPSRRQRFMLTPPITRLAARLGAHLPPPAYRALLAPMFGEPARMPLASVAAYAAILGQPQLGAAAAGYAQHWRRDLERLSSALARVTTPVLLVWGERDRAVPLPTAAALRAALPDARLAIVPTAGHMPFEELPDAFCQIVLPFLTGHGV